MSKKIDLPNTIAPYKMDRERRAVHRLVDIEDEIVVRCFEVIQISDNCKSQRCSRASCALFHVVVETIAPKITYKEWEKRNTENEKVNNNSNQLFMQTQILTTFSTQQNFSKSKMFKFVVPYANGITKMYEK